jgi:hypothetical protein
LPNRGSVLAFAGTFFVDAFGAMPRASEGTGLETVGAETGPIWGVVAMLASVEAFASPSASRE